VNRHLERQLARYARSAAVLDEGYGRLLKALQDVLAAGGKRLRPLLTVLAYRGYGGTNNAILQVAAAQELLHMGLIIHDDIIDRDFVRHGVNNIGGQYRAYYRGYTDGAHFADAAALLAGDLALSYAHQEIIEAGFSAEQRLAALATLSQSFMQVVGGELLDVEAALGERKGELALKISYAKTATYSFVGPLVTGAQLAGVQPTAMAQLQAFGSDLGIAFQLADDLLGVFGEEHRTGKPVLHDLREGKRTYLLECLEVHLEGAEAQEVAAIVGNQQATIQELKLVRDLMETTGARVEVERVMEQYAAQARSHIPQLGVAATAESVFDQLVDRVLWRSA